MAKLTKAQFELLKEIDEESTYVSQAYKPAIKLVKFGYAGFDRFSTLTITADGRDALMDPSHG